jgi:hypothetical protein
VVTLLYPFISLVSFVVAVVAAVWAIELYRLLRAGEGGHAWRVLIIASAVFAVQQLYAIGRGLGYFEFAGVAEITEVVFVTLLAYAFYTQRRAFFRPQLHRGQRGEYRRERMNVSSLAFPEEDTLDEESPLTVNRQPSTIDH